MRTGTDTVVRIASLLLVLATVPVLAGAAEPSGTIANLKVAHEADVHAQARYLAFAGRAEEEGFANAAALFRAAAHAEGIRAQAHGAVLRRLGVSPTPVTPLPGKVSGTRANLLVTLGQENAERFAVYPRFVDQARQDAVPDAILTFTQAHRSEEGLVRLYQEAIPRLTTASSGKEEFHVCEVCGHVVRGPPPERCPVSLSPRSAFTAVR